MTNRIGVDVGKTTCAKCDRKVQARGLCGSHYKQWWQENNSLIYVCQQCGQGFRPRGGKQKYCKPTCQRRAARGSRCTTYALSRYVPPTVRPTLVVGGYWTAGICKVCSSSFVSRYADNTCSDECRAIRQRRRRQSKNHRRRARVQGSRIEPVTVSAVFRRDHYMCQLCFTPADMAAHAPSPLAPTLDHIVPIARGGSHTTDNVQLAHFICNSRKSDSLKLAQRFVDMMGHLPLPHP